MKAKTYKISIALKENGEINLEAISVFKRESFWNTCLLQKQDSVRNKYSLKNKSSFGYQGKFDSFELLKAIDVWLPIKCRNYISESKLDIIKYLYAGDITLGIDCEDGVLGLSTVMAQKLSRIRFLNTLYFYYCVDCADSFSLYPKYSKESRLEFCRIIVENLRIMLAEIWDYKFLEAKLKAGFSLEFLELIESIFFSYELIKSPARQSKILAFIREQKALPKIENVRKKYHLISALLEEKFQDIKANNSSEKEKAKPSLIESIIEKLSAFWLSHIDVLGLVLEDDPSRFNDDLEDLIESLTDAQLRACEKRKNMESGAKSRQVRKEENTSLKAVERFRKMRPLKLSIDGEENANVLKKAEEISKDSIYCPDDYSAQAWERFDYNQRLFLVAYELSSSLDSKAGFMSIFREEVGTKSSYVLLNIARLILEEILDENIEEVNALNKKTIAKEINNLAVENNCLLEIEYVLSKLRSTKILEILEGENLDENSLKIKSKAYEIFDKLRAKTLNK